MVEPLNSPVFALRTCTRKFGSGALSALWATPLTAPCPWAKTGMEPGTTRTVTKTAAKFFRMETPMSRHTRHSNRHGAPVQNSLLPGTLLLSPNRLSSVNVRLGQKGAISIKNATVRRRKDKELEGGSTGPRNSTYSAPVVQRMLSCLIFR